MNTNYEAINSLIGLLVKKAGFDVEKSYSTEEYDKTKELINKYSSNSYFLNDLKKRKTNLENNAEVIGKFLLNAYKEGKKYEDVKQKIEDLAIIAKEDEKIIKDCSLMSYVYHTTKELESGLETIKAKIEENDYYDIQEKEADVKMQTYLENKINEVTEEKTFVRNEIERINDIILKDEVALKKLLDKKEKIENNSKRLKKAKEDIDEKIISVEVWEKLKITESKLLDSEKLIKEEIQKVESMLEKNKRNIQEYEVRKKELDEDYIKCTNSYESISEKINSNDYTNYTNITIDENKYEKIKSTLENLKNKKEVIYVDVEQVKKELISEWKKRVPYTEETKKDSSDSQKQEKEILTEEIKKEPEEIKEVKIEKPIETKKEEKPKIELDW